jgi:hypothetical protein
MLWEGHYEENFIPSLKGKAFDLNEMIYLQDGTLPQTALFKRSF